MFDYNLDFPTAIFTDILECVVDICRGCVVEETQITLPGEREPRQAVRVEVTGKGHYTGSCRFTVELDDVLSLNGGFIIK